MDTAVLAANGESVVRTPEEANPQARRRQGALPTLLIAAGALALGAAGATLIQRHNDQANAVVATVNGVAITRDQFYHRLEVTSGPTVLRQMVAEESQLQFAQKQGALPPESDIDRMYDAASKQPQFAANLAASHQTPEDIKRALRLHQIEKLALTQGVSVTDAEIQAFYRLNTDRRNPTARYYRPETVHAAVIVSDRPEAITQALKALKQGQSFAQVAQAYSKDASRANGGLLNPIVTGRTNMSAFPGLEARLFAMQPGQQIDRLQMRNLWWIVRCVARTPAVTLPFDKVSEECRTGAMLTKGLPANGAKTQQAYNEFVKKTTVQAVWPQYKENLAAK